MAGVGDAHVLGGDGAGPPAYGNAGGDEPADLRFIQPQLQHQKGQPGPECAHGARGDARQARAKTQCNHVRGVLQHEFHAGVGDAASRCSAFCFVIDS